MARAICYTQYLLVLRGSCSDNECSCERQVPSKFSSRNAYLICLPNLNFSLLTLPTAATSLWFAGSEICSSALLPFQGNYQR